MCYEGGVLVDGDLDDDRIHVACFCWNWIPVARNLSMIASSSGLQCPSSARPL